MNISEAHSSLKKIVKSNSFSEKEFIRAHHSLMRWYGWISLDEFKKLPIITFLNLINCQKEENEKQQKNIKNGTKKH